MGFTLRAKFPHSSSRCKRQTFSFAVNAKPRYFFCMFALPFLPRPRGCRGGCVSGRKFERRTGHFLRVKGSPMSGGVARPSKGLRRADEILSRSSRSPFSHQSTALALRRKPAEALRLLTPLSSTVP